MMNKLSDKMRNFAYWVGMPLGMLVMDDERKWLRVTCFLLTVSLLSPLFLIGMCFWMLAFFVFMYEEI